jgi:hypothetical protein
MHHPWQSNSAEHRLPACRFRQLAEILRQESANQSLVTHHFSLVGYGLGRGGGVGRGLGVGVDRGVSVAVAVGVTVAVAVAVGVGLGVTVAVGVALALGVAVAVAVAVAVGVGLGGVGVGVEVGVGLAVGVGVGVGPPCAQYLPPVAKLLKPLVPPQTIISLPLQIAVSRYRGEGAFVVLVAVQVSVPASYLPPVLKPVTGQQKYPPQTSISLPVHTAV